MIDFGFPLPVAFDLVRTTRSAFAEAAWRPAPGSRSTSPAAMTTSPAADTPGPAAPLSPGSRPPAGPAFFARIGEGYKLPSFYALGHPLIGNPALRPERSRNVEAGVEWAPRRRTTARPPHLVRQWVQGPDRLRSYRSSPPSTATGSAPAAPSSRDAGRSAPAFVLAGALTWLDLDSPTPLRGRPRWQGVAAPVWRARDGLELNAAFRANSRFNDSIDPDRPGRRRAAMPRLDLGLRYRLSRRLTLDAALAT